MKSAFLFASLLLFFHSAIVSLAHRGDVDKTNEELVHEGMALEQAFEKAKKLCPDRLIGGQYGQKTVVAKIHMFKALAQQGAYNPVGKGWLKYVPTESEINEILHSMCGVDLVGDSPTLQQNENELVQDRGTLSSRKDFESENDFTTNPKKIDYQSLFLFSLGLVIGMLFVFICTSRLQASPVQTSKSLRRPEL